MFADARFGRHQQTTPFFLIHHNAYPPRPPPSPTATTNHDAEQPDTAHDEHRTPQNSENDAATPRHHAQLSNARLQDGKTECHVADSDVATKRRMTTSVVVRRFRLSKYLSPIPVTRNQPVVRRFRLSKYLSPIPVTRNQPSN